MSETKNIKIDIKPTGIQSGYIEEPFDIAKQKLESEGYKIISLKDNALLRIQQGKYHDVCKNGNWTREGFIITPDNKFYLTKSSPIMEYPVEATNAHRNGEEFYLTDEQVKKALEDSIEINNREIPTKRFGEDNITVYAFGDIAEDYGLFLKDAGIKEMPIWLPDPEGKPFARALWFGDLGYWSGLDGYWDLCYSGRVRGVRYAEGVAEKNEELYNPTQIKKALEDLKLLGLEDKIIRALRR